MAVRCSRCGEELLGAVNRCWKCGQDFQVRPTVDGLPPVRAEVIAASAAAATAPAGQALEARVLDDATTAVGADLSSQPARTRPLPPHPLDTPTPPRSSVSRAPTNVAAEGGAYAALLLGLFGIVLSWSLFYGALVALVGLLAGIWGIYSPRRNIALVGMLLCAIAIGLGTFTGLNQAIRYWNRNAPIETATEEEAEITPP